MHIFLSTHVILFLFYLLLPSCPLPHPSVLPSLHHLGLWEGITGEGDPVTLLDSLLSPSCIQRTETVVRPSNTVLSGWDHYWLFSGCLCKSIHSVLWWSLLSTTFRPPPPPPNGLFMPGQWVAPAGTQRPRGFSTRTMVVSDSSSLSSSVPALNEIP